MTKRHHRFLTFFIDDHICAIPIAAVREINHFANLSSEHDPQHLHFIHLRDTVIPFIELRPRLGLETKDANISSRVIILESKDGLVATHVDSIHRIIDLGADPLPNCPKTEPEKSFFTSIDLHSIHKQQVIIIDIIRCLFTPTQIVAENFFAITASYNKVS